MTNRTISDSILFLDIDGVMNTTDSALRHKGAHVFTPAAVNGLRAIIRATRCVIVISSTRRRDGAAAMRQLFMRNGLITEAGHLTSHTPILTDSDTDDLREDEIGKWIDDHNFHGNFAILDDKPLSGPMRRHLVLTDHDAGLTPLLAARVITLLMGN